MTDQLHRINSEAALQALPYGIIIAEPTGAIQFMNGAAARLLEIGSLHGVGDQLDDLPHHEVIRRCCEHPGVSETIELTAMDRYLDLDQRRWLSLQAILLTDADQPGPPQIIITVQDPSPIERAKESNAEFLSITTSELRSSLTAVRGFADLLLLITEPLSETQQQFITVMRHNAIRGMTILNHLLDIARLDTNTLQLNISQFELSTVVNEVVANFHDESLKKQLQIECHLAPDLPALIADQRRIAQVLTILLANAHAYTEPGGTIAIHAYYRNRMVQVDVQDTGVGITAESVPFIFRRFYRAYNRLTEQTWGVGLNLHIARALIALHQGSIWFDSSEEIGSTFHFALPVQIRSDT